MSAAEMQACLARLYVDGAFRRLLAVDPEFVFSAYSLSAEERAAVTGIEARELESFACGLVRKRRDRMATAFPRLFQRGGPALERYFARYHQFYPSRPYEDALADTLTCNRFLYECFLGDDEEPTWVADLTLYEGLVLRAGLAIPTGQAAGALADDMCLRIAPGAAFGTFRCHVVEVVKALDTGADPSAAPGGEHIFVLRGDEEFLISPPVRDLLERCDGATPVAALDPRGRAALQSLLEAGVLTPFADAGLQTPEFMAETH